MSLLKCDPIKKLNPMTRKFKSEFTPNHTNKIIRENSSSPELEEMDQ